MAETIIGTLNLSNNRLKDVPKVLLKHQQLTFGARCTLPETNIAPENGWLEYYFPIGDAYFQGLC